MKNSGEALKDLYKIWKSVDKDLPLLSTNNMNFEVITVNNSDDEESGPSPSKQPRTSVPNFQICRLQIPELNVESSLNNSITPLKCSTQTNESALQSSSLSSSPIQTASSNLKRDQASSEGNDTLAQNLVKFSEEMRKVSKINSFYQNIRFKEKQRLSKELEIFISTNDFQKFKNDPLTPKLVQLAELAEKVRAFIKKNNNSNK